MKLKLITIIALLFLAIANAKAQYVNLPDSNFRNDIRNKWPGAFNGSGQMDTSNFQIITANQLVSINANIKDLTGVKFFKSITSLLCSGNRLTTLPELPPNLISIYCNDNQFTSIPPIPRSVILLSIYNNQVTSVNSLPNTLKYLIVNNNPITVIDSLPNQLISLSCSFTSLRSLPPLPNTLEQLVCANNKISVLPALPASLTELTCTEDTLTSLPTLPASLIYLYCAKNFLQNLPPLPNQLTILKCQENKLTSLPALPQTLKDLSCAYNQLSSLPALPDSLITLSCYNNILTALPVLPNKLQSLYCSNNLLDSLPALPALLETIDCQSNHIDTLPTLPVSLISLNCSQNLLLALPLLPESLKYLYTPNNFLTTLPSLPLSLRQLSCEVNQINSLPSLPDSLDILNASQNQLSNIPSFPKSLTTCILDNNQLTSIPTLPDTISNLSVSGNINLKCLPFLPKNLLSFYYSGTGIYCVPNIPLNCQFSPTNPQICVATNNVNQCNSFPQIFGFVYNDNNSNGIFDNGDAPRENIKVKLNNGNYAITNNKGYYNITADTIGSYRTDVETPPFFSPVPISNIHLFSNYSDIVYDTFALQSILVKDSVSVHILPLEQKARPGFLFSYNLNCENVGTTILNTVMRLNFDTSRLAFDSASLAGIIINPTNLVLSIGNMIPGQVQNFTGFFHLKQNAVIGDSLKARAEADAIVASSFDTTISPISGSYDPNSKQATPVLTPIQVATGGFIEYIIHFQNTGNDTAFNIVIADTLSPKLRTNFLQMLGSSHPCRTTLGSNFITFEFIHINLPDSGTNFNKSIGYVHFRIRPDSTLIIGDSISNKASIYFDFNTPFVTNTCQTHIHATILPLNLLKFTSKLQKYNIVMNEWVTANEINTNYFNLQRSENGKDFITITKVTAQGNNFINSYQYGDHLSLMPSSKKKEGSIYYRLEMLDKDGKKTYSAIQSINITSHDSYTYYPNPAHNVVRIEGENIAIVNIAEMSGRILISKRNLNEGIIELDINHLPKGVYVLKVTNANEITKSDLLIVE